MPLENIVEICVAIDIAILGIAYPIIVDKITNIGDKYGSQYIPVLFNREFPQKRILLGISFFQAILYATLLSLIPLIIKRPPPRGWENWFTNSSADIFVLILSITLIVFFIFWLNKVALYSGQSTSLLKHLVSKYNTTEDGTDDKTYQLKAINELAFYAIQNQDEHLQETLLEFYYALFSAFRKNHDTNEPLVYPVDLYFFVRKLNSETVENENRKLRAIEHRAVSGVWLLGEDKEIKISEQTYRWLWSNLYITCEKPRLVKMFWANSNTFFTYRLKHVQAHYNRATHELANKNEIDTRNNERKNFLEFHYALGGLLLYRKEYDSIKYILEYSQSQPPNYVLLPDSMTEIFFWFEHFSNDFKHDTPIDRKYEFPELDNLGNSGQVPHWICCYLCLLFIRQYSLNQYYVYQNFTALPTLPNNVVELGNWLDKVSYFQKSLQSVINNEQLMLAVGFSDVIARHKIDFEEFLTKLKDGITEKIGQQKLQAPLSDDKVKTFYESSGKILSNAFAEYDKMFSEITPEHQSGELKLVIKGVTTTMSKSAFTDGEIPNINYDTVFAGSVSMDTIKRLIPNSLMIARTQRYLFNTTNFSEALVKIINGRTDILIVGVNLGFEVLEILESNDLQRFVREIPSTEYQSQDQLFILPAKDLPAIEHREITEEEIKELSLISINDQLKIYASVLELSKKENENIKSKWATANNPEGLDLKVQLTLSFITVIHWKNDREVIQVNIASAYREQGIQNEISDIKPMQNDQTKKSEN